MIRVTCAIICSEGKILVTQRGLGMKLPMKWEFPGGKVEEGESDEQCLMREIAEELGITIEIVSRMQSFVHDYNDFRIELIPFIANFVNGEIILKEHAEYLWLSPDELMHLDWAPADVPVVKAYLNS